MACFKSVGKAETQFIHDGRLTVCLLNEATFVRNCVNYMGDFVIHGRFLVLTLTP